MRLGSLPSLVNSNKFPSDHYYFRRILATTKTRSIRPGPHFDITVHHSLPHSISIYPRHCQNLHLHRNFRMYHPDQSRRHLPAASPSEIVIEVLWLTQCSDAFGSGHKFQCYRSCWTAAQLGWSLGWSLCTEDHCQSNLEHACLPHWFTMMTKYGNGVSLPFISPILDQLPSNSSRLLCSNMWHSLFPPRTALEAFGHTISDAQFM